MYEIPQTPPAPPTAPPAPMEASATPPRKTTGFRKFHIPLVAQITGVLSLILLVAGLLTAQQLSQSSQDIASMAQSAPAMDLSIQPATKTIAVNSDATFNVEINPNGRQPTAAHIILKYDPTFISIHKGNYVSPFTNILHDLEPKDGSTVVAVGTIPSTIITAKSNLYTFVVTAKNKKGTTKVTLEGTEAAAAGFSTNQGKITGDLSLTIGDAPPTGGNACVSKTASKIVAGTPPTTTSLPADSKVNRGDTIEYKITLKPQSTSAVVVIKDTLPAHVEYVRNSLKLNGTPITQSEAPVNGSQLSVSFALNGEQRNRDHVFSYQVKVKADAPATKFTNSAKVFFKTSSTATETEAGNCAITLSAETTTPPTGTSPKLNLMFRVQGVTKAGITKEAEVAIRYKHKTTGEIIKKTYPPKTLTSSAAANGAPAGTFVDANFELKDLNLAEVDTSTTAYPSMGTGIEVFVKTPTSLRKKLGELTYQSTNAPVTLRAIFITEDVKLLIGDYDRATQPINQVNVLRTSDIGKFISQFTDLSHPITGPTDPKIDYDIDNNGVLNSLDLSLLISNLTDISVKGEEL